MNLFDTEHDLLIKQLHQVISLLSRNEKDEEKLSKYDKQVFAFAQKYFGEKFFFTNNYQKFLKNLRTSDVYDYIKTLEKNEKKKKKEKEAREREEERMQKEASSQEELNEEDAITEEIEEITGQKQEASIPPELQALVAEYLENKALLEKENGDPNSKKTVAQQVKIAIAHSKIRELALANRVKRRKDGEEFQGIEESFVSLGAPKSPSKEEALHNSYQAIIDVALTYESFNKLSETTQETIIHEAVELNTVCVTNIDVAIQSAALLTASSPAISPSEKQDLTNISSNFIHSVYDAVNTQTTQMANLESQIAENEVVLLQLNNEAKVLQGDNYETKLLQIKSLTEKNELLETKIENLPKQLDVFINNQETEFKVFNKESHERLTKDPDLVDIIEIANKEISQIHTRLVANGVEPHIFTPLDDVHLLEEAIRKDLPGKLKPVSTFKGEYAAALANHPQTKSPDLTPELITLHSKGLNSELLAEARTFAQKEPSSALGKLFSKNQTLFDTSSKTIKKIESSPLSKEITQTPTGIGKAFVPVSNFFNKVSDRLPKGLGQKLRVIQHPIASLRSWAGRKSGEYVLRQIVSKIKSEALRKTSESLVTVGLKKTVQNLTKQAVVKIAVKLGIQATLSSTGVGIIAAIAIEVGVWIFKKTKSAVNKISETLWGERIKTRDVVIIAAAGTAGVVSFIRSVTAATVAAASSAVVILIIGTLAGGFFYITSIVVAPLISTLVQLESNPPSDNYGALNFDCGPDAGAEIMVDAGKYPVMLKLLTGPGRTGYCITPTKITIHWSGGWSSNDITYNVLVLRGLSCQIGTDQDGSVQQWQQMWENKAELAYCTGGNENNYCLNNEMVGAYFIPPGTVSSDPRDRSPSEDEIQSAVNTTCFMMKQYNIPSSQIFGHYQLMPGKIDPGEEFLAYFINRVEQQCP